jgi:transcription elongation factor Elf1
MRGEESELNSRMPVIEKELICPKCSHVHEAIAFSDWSDLNDKVMCMGCGYYWDAKIHVENEKLSEGVEAWLEANEGL